VGDAVGLDVGTSVGLGLGTSVGDVLGTTVGLGLGTSVDGTGTVGDAVGLDVGTTVGLGLGTFVGLGLGTTVGLGLGTTVGLGLGTTVGLGLGTSVGLGLGTSVGLGLGTTVGLGLGTSVDGTSAEDFIGAGVGESGCRKHFPSVGFAQYSSHLSLLQVPQFKIVNPLVSDRPQENVLHPCPTIGPQWPLHFPLFSGYVRSATNASITSAHVAPSPSPCISSPHRLKEVCIDPPLLLPYSACELTHS